MFGLLGFGESVGDGVYEARELPRVSKSIHRALDSNTHSRNTCKVAFNVQKELVSLSFHPFAQDEVLPGVTFEENVPAENYKQWDRNHLINTHEYISPRMSNNSVSV